MCTVHIHLDEWQRKSQQFVRISTTTYKILENFVFSVAFIVSQREVLYTVFTEVKDNQPVHILPLLYHH